MNIILQVVVVGAHESVAKIPGMIFEYFIINRKSEGFHIFGDEDGDRAGISLAKWMDLPDAGCEGSQVLNDLLQCQAAVGKNAFFLEIVIQCVANTLPWCVDNRFSVQHPLGLADVVGAPHSGMIDDAGEQTLVDVLKFDWRKLEGIFA